MWENNHLIEKYIQQVEQYRLENKPTVPTTLEFEKKLIRFYRLTVWRILLHFVKQKIIFNETIEKKITIYCNGK